MPVPGELTFVAPRGAKPPRHLADLDVSGPERVPFWISKAQYAYWSHTHLTVDLVPGRGAGFSAEAPTGFRFLIRSRLFSDEETEGLAQI